MLPPQARLLQQQAKLRHGHSLQAIQYQFQQRLTAPLASGLILPLTVALLFWAILVWTLFKEQNLIYLIPGVLFTVFCHYVVVLPWHSGLMFPYVIAVLWMTWPKRRNTFSLLPRHEQAVIAAFAVIIVVQMYWAAWALNFDRTHPYFAGGNDCNLSSSLFPSGAPAFWKQGTISTPRP